MNFIIKKTDLRQSILCITYLAILLLNWYSIYIDSITPRLISYILIFVVFISYLRGKGESSIPNERKKGLKTIYISIAFLIPSVLGVLFGNRYLFDSDGVYQVLQPFLFVFLGYIFASKVDETHRNRLYKVILILLLFTVIFCFTSGNITYDNRYYSAFSNAILCGFYFMICFHLSNYFIKNTYIKIFVLLVIAYAIVLTQSRSAWFALVISFVLGLISRKKEKLSKTRFITYISLVAFSILAYIICYEQIENVIVDIWGIVFKRFENFSTHGSTTQRLGTIYYVFKNTNPLLLVIGQGVGALSELLRHTTITISGFTTSDNAYLSIIYDYGVFGLVCCCKLFSLIKEGLFNNKFRYPCEVKLFSMILVSIGVGAFFFEVLGWASLSAVTLSFIGILYRLSLERI